MATLETQYKNFKINNPNSTFTFEEWKEDFGKKLEKSIKRLEVEKIIDDVYNDYQNHFLGHEDVPNKELFLLQCNVDKNFSERWGLQIEKRKLNSQERKDIYDKTEYVKDIFPTDENGWNKLFDSFGIATKLTRVTYNNEIKEYYE